MVEIQIDRRVEEHPHRLSATTRPPPRQKNLAPARNFPNPPSIPLTTQIAGEQSAMVTDEQFQALTDEMRGGFRAMREEAAEFRRDIIDAFQKLAKHLDERLEPIETRLGRLEDEFQTRFNRIEGALHRAGDALSNF
ncbi:MAG TPA: hypothetical protein VFF06_16940 [Polyangia bacterium]|nr:hypothetical protein [Polyangia bacterium]